MGVPLGAQDPVSNEYRIRAAFLYNFFKFVEWPPSAPTDGPLSICVAGRNPFGPVLEETIKGESINGRPLDTRVILEPEPGCHIVFVPDGAATTACLRAASGTPTLTVGERPDFIAQGGIRPRHRAAARRVARRYDSGAQSRTRDRIDLRGHFPVLLDAVRVLVVDDEDDARVLLETALRQYGAQVATAANADDAMAEIDRQRPDVLLSDIGMPNEDGYSLLKRLRARPAARGGTIPAVAVTAYASAQDRRAAEAAGFQAHVAKPFEPAEFARLVASLGRGTRTATS